jgi:hypothetical protein
MALDSWVPHRFAQLSDRLVMQNGVFLMGLAAVGALLYTRGDITTLVVMYSINVFITFSLTELGMARHWIVERAVEPRWKSQLAIHGTGLVLCVTILAITLYEKFAEGGWVTTAITSATIAGCVLIRRHYRRVRQDLSKLDDALVLLPPSGPPPTTVLAKNTPTAILTVDRFSGYGLHQVLNILQLFPGHFKRFVFVSVAVVDSGSFKGAAEVEALEKVTRTELEKYVDWCTNHGLVAEYRLAVDREAVERIAAMCIELGREYPRAMVFSGKLIFKDETLMHRLLHSETALSIQRRVQNAVPAIVLPVRVV